MKKHVVALVLTALVYTPGAWSQSVPGKKRTPPPEKTDQQLVSEIDKTTLAIKMNLESFKKTTTKKITDTNGSSSRETFRDASNIQLIALNNSKSNGEQTRLEYYFVQGQLIYVEQLKASADHKISVEKFYLLNGRLAAWLNANEQLADKRSPAFKAVDDSLSTYGEKLKKEPLN